MQSVLSGVAGGIPPGAFGAPRVPSWAVQLCVSPCPGGPGGGWRAWWCPGDGAWCLEAALGSLLCLGLMSYPHCGIT